MTRFFNEFPIGSNAKLSSAVAAILVVKGYYSEGGLPKDHFIKVWFQLCKWFHVKVFFNAFPIGSNVKLSSAMAAILVGGLGHRL